MSPMAPTRPNRPVIPPLPRSAPQGAAPSVPEPPQVKISGRRCRVPIMADLAAPAAARAVVGEAIHTWRVPVDPEIAILLTSELMANAVTHGKQDETAFVLLAIACDAAGLRVEVHDASPELPVPNVSLLDEATATTAEEGRGLLLVAALSDEWGFYRTPTGKAVFFRMDLQAPPGFTRFE